MRKRIFSIALLMTFVFSLFCPTAQASGTTGGEKMVITVSGSGYASFDFLTDGGIKGYQTSNGNCTLQISSAAGQFGSLYLMFDLEYGEYTIKDNDNDLTVTAGQYRYLHEYVQLPQPTTSVTITFSRGSVRLSEISAYSPGGTPEGIQIWQPPLDDKTDILLLATHGDDDQLFFAGLFPLYAAERGLNVQVAYLTDHRNLTNLRTHEMLNGLWATGVTAYPVFGDFADFLIEDLNGTYDEYERLGTSYEQLQGFVVEQIRRFNPQVVVAHDFAGEYGHGMHMVYTDLLINSLNITNDESYYTDSANQYGLWEIPKVYIHLYTENQIYIDYDTPLESFDGLTAFQVTQKYGYPCHETQQYTWFTKWINGKTEPITKASQIATYNPCEFGLYHSLVGDDVQKNDFMENIIPYAQQQSAQDPEQEQPQDSPETLPDRTDTPTEDSSKNQDSDEPRNNTIWIILLIVLLVLLLLFLFVKGGTSKGGKYSRKRRRRRRPDFGTK